MRIFSEGRPSSDTCISDVAIFLWFSGADTRYRNGRFDGPYPASRVTFADYERTTPVHNDILSYKAAKNPYLAASLRRLVVLKKNRNLNSIKL